tara:strand:+ start:313 stop:600 length:288 start_codon:yes stop_codon:yes gene_type:complete
MQKYFNIYWAGQPTVLLNASEIQSIDQTSTTTTVLGYSSRAAADKVTLTHLADASGVAVQNFLVSQLGVLLSTSYQNAAPIIKLPQPLNGVPTIG